MATVALLGDFDPWLADHLTEHEVVWLKKPDEARLASVLGALDGIVIRSPFILDQSHAAAATRLKWIIRAGSGLNNISPQFTARGVQVTSVPLNARAVAELVLGLTLSVARNIVAGHASLQQGEWWKARLVGRLLARQTMGILGFGRIGREVARLAHGFCLSIIVWDRSPENPEKAAVARSVAARFLSFAEVLRASDVLVACLPETEHTKGLLSPSALDQLKPGAILVNVGRGSLVDLDDLERRLVDGSLGGVALDVFATEPPGRHPIFSHPKAVCTPHLGAQTHETRRDIARTVVSHIAVLSGHVSVAVTK